MFKESEPEVGNFGTVGVGVGYFTSDSVTLVHRHLNVDTCSKLCKHCMAGRFLENPTSLFSTEWRILISKQVLNFHFIHFKDVLKVAKPFNPGKGARSSANGLNTPCCSALQLVRLVNSSHCRCASLKQIRPTQKVYSHGRANTGARSELWRQECSKWAVTSRELSPAQCNWNDWDGYSVLRSLG